MPRTALLPADRPSKIAIKSMVRAPKAAKYERRRREIIDAAAAVFAEYGYHGASTKIVADRVGIRQGSLYYYFASKEEALEEVCLAGVEEFVQGLADIAASEASATDKVRAAVLNHLAPLKDFGDYTRTFINERRYLPPDCRRAVGRLIRRYERLMTNIFRAGVARGEFRADLDCGLAALALIGQCNATLQWHGRRYKFMSVERLADEYAALCVTGVRT